MLENNKNLKILTIGGAVQDFTFKTEQGVLINNKKDLIKQKLIGFEFGAKINIKNADFTFGGGASNSAVSFTKLENIVSCLICVSEDTIGNEIIKNLKQHKIKTNLIQKSNKQSGLSVVLNINNLNEEHILFTYRGANEDLDASRLRSLTTLCSSYLRQGYGGQASSVNFDLIYLTSLSGKNIKNNLAQVFKYKRDILKQPVNLRKGKNKNIKIAWNPGNEQIKMGLEKLKQYLKETDIFIINKDEAIEICLEFKNKIKLNNPRELLKILAKYCSGVVVITNREKGAYSIFNKKIFYESSCQIKVEDTTGVGDAFGSTFSWALLTTNYNIQKSLQLAIKNACSVLKQTGAQNGLLSVKNLKLKI